MVHHSSGLMSEGGCSITHRHNTHPPLYYYTIYTIYTITTIFLKRCNWSVTASFIASAHILVPGSRKHIAEAVSRKINVHCFLFSCRYMIHPIYSVFKWRCCIVPTTHTHYNCVKTHGYKRR